MKDRAKTFMFISIGIMALAVAFQMGAGSVKAQAGGDIAVVYQQNNTVPIAVTRLGDVYVANNLLDAPGVSWEYRHNIFGDGVPASGESISNVKSMFGR